MNCKNKSFMTKKKAFTLIELLIVIAIIGILFIVLVSKVDFATDKAKASGVQTDFRSFQMAFETVARENAGFDSLVDGDDLSELVTMLNKNLDAKLQIVYENGEMIINAKDPWKVAYSIEYHSANDGKDRGTIVVYSGGANLAVESSTSVSEGSVHYVNTTDDYVLSTIYSIYDGAGKVVSTTSGFTNNQTAEVNNAIPTMIDYDAVVTPAGDATFSSSADLGDLNKILIDGNEVDTSNYTVRSGSTIVVLKKEYIATLTAGTHTIDIVSTTGTASVDFEVVNQVCFSLDGNTYYITEEMTFMEWVLSTAKGSSDNNGIVYIDSDNLTVWLDEGCQYKDVVVSGTKVGITADHIIKDGDVYVCNPLAPTP